MKAYYLMVFAAGLLAFGDAVHASTRDVENYLDKASKQAVVEVTKAGVDVSPGVRVKARVSSDGRLLNATVVTSSGSQETDRKTEKALRRLRVLGPPNELIGVDVTVAVGPPGFVQAKTP